MFAKLLPKRYLNSHTAQGLPVATNEHQSAEFKVDGSEAPQRDEDALLLDDHGRPIPPWYHQVTLRALFTGACISVLFNIMVLKLAFTVGIIPSLNVAAGLLGFVGLKALTVAMGRVGWGGLPFTQQENTVIQTSVVAGYSLAFSGGFSSFLLGMDWTSYLQSSDGANSAAANEAVIPYTDPPNPLPPDVIQPNLGKYIGFMFLIGFAGICVLVPLRKICIIDFRLTYPSGTATGVMIRGFHTPQGEAVAREQVKSLGKWGAASILWSMFKWCFSGYGDSCGFDSFPSLGFTAYYWKWYFDFSQTYVGIGLICPIQVTYSLVCGAILSYGIMWPLISNRQSVTPGELSPGSWFPYGRKYGEAGSNVSGLYGYKVFVSVGLIIGDGLFNIVRLLIVTIASISRGKGVAQSLELGENGQAVHAHPTEKGSMTEDAPARLKHMTDTPTPEMDAKLAPAGEEAVEQYTEPHQYGTHNENSPQELLRIRELRDKVFMTGVVPFWLAAGAYVCIAALSIGIMPQLWPGVKAYYVVVVYILAPIFAFCNAYGMGLTDWSLITTYGKVIIFIIAAWGGHNGGVIAGLACAVAMGVCVGSAADLMQDFKTGWLTFSSPRAMFIAQLSGMACACFIAPLCFWLYWKGFTLGVPDSNYPAPFATLYRSMAVLAVDGSSALPKHCLALAGGAFGFAILVNIFRVYCCPPRYRRLIPIPMALGIPTYLGPYFTIDMAVGACILATYRWVNKVQSKRFAPIIASALIAGDGVWTVISAILALAGAVAPMCLTFTKGDETTVGNNPSYPIN